jgi:hypothetical protein
MQRVRLYDLRLSRLPRIAGLCSSDIPEICAYVNAAQSRLLHAAEAGNEGWHGTYAEIGFNVSRTNPYITLPRDIARLEGITVCDQPIPVNNEFIQYLVFGSGRLRKDRRCDPSVLQSVSRNNAVTFVDLSSPPQYLRAYLSDARDVGKRVLFQGKDSNDNTIYSQDNFVEVTGIFVALDSPFVTSTLQFNTISGIQKDVTSGKVEIFQVDPTTGAEVLLLTMEPGEMTASYRRYFFNRLPCNCCPTAANTTGTVQVTAIAKMELIPLVVDTDYTVLTGQGAIEAIIHEVQSVKYDESDSPNAKAMAISSHRQAIRLLTGQLSHYEGIENVSVGFFPFGSADLRRVDISMI